MSWFGPRTRGGGDWYSILFVSVTSANKDIIYDTSVSARWRVPYAVI